MTKFWKDGHWRTSINGDTHWVSGHWVERNDWNTFSSYGGPNRYSTDQNYFVLTQITSFESFVNPNAICPVCGEQVFFYQSPYGGKVYFDALGPPWPKHPCTDFGATPIYSASFHEKKVQNFKWQDNGWVPFIVTDVSKLGDGVVKLTGISPFFPESADLYINESSVTPTAENFTIFQIKKIDNKSYDISTFNTFDGVNIRIEEIKFVGYTKQIFLTKSIKSIAGKNALDLSTIELAFQKALKKT